jgi:predicted component of type VI protein secretion system
MKYALPLLALVGCSAAPQLTPAQRVQLEVLALQTACAEAVKSGRPLPAEVLTVCEAFEAKPLMAPAATEGSWQPGQPGQGVRRVE